MLAGVGWGWRDPDGDGPLMGGLCSWPFADAPHTTRPLRPREQMTVAVAPSARTFSRRLRPSACQGSGPGPAWCRERVVGA